MNIKSFFEPTTSTFTYVISDPETNRSVVIDPVLDYKAETARTTTNFADQILGYVKEKQLRVDWIFETHIHADHLSASQYLKEHLGAKIGIGSKITSVLDHWVPMFNTFSDTPLDGSQFDALFEDNQSFSIGHLNISVLHTPGHTPSCVSYLINDAVFVGDTIFNPDFGTARTDFPGGSAADLYASIQRILALPDSTRIFVGHDYPKESQKERCESTVLEQRKKNIHVHHGITEQAFVDIRTSRDKALSAPRLLLPAIQFNLRAGNFGACEENGVCYIKLPVNTIE